MFDTDISTLDADATLTFVTVLDRGQNLVEARRLQIAAHWADLNSALVHSSLLPGAERMVPPRRRRDTRRGGVRPGRARSRGR